VRTIVKGKNLDVSEEDRRYVQQKMRRLERLLDDRSEAIVELSVERHRSQDDSRIVEVTLVIDGRTVRGVAAAATHHAAVDEVVDKLERQTVEHKERPRERRASTAPRELKAAAAAGVVATEPDRGRRVVKIKRFAIEPMFEEDAIAQMEELGHSFFIFVNAETERVGVLYRRDDGDYGLIEPAIGGEYTPWRSAGASKGGKLA
jgi:putative sigma-54 modulation protein